MDYNYEIARVIIDCEFSQYEHHPIMYIQAMGWSEDKIKEICSIIQHNNIAFTKEDVEELAEMVKAKRLKYPKISAYQLFAEEDFNDYAVNCVAKHLNQLSLTYEKIS